jgi:NAD+ synthase
VVDFQYNLPTVWEKKIEYIVDWLKRQLDETHTDGFVVGLSGGLDSSVCAALIKRASDDSLGLILPMHSDVKDLDDAAEIASVLGLPTEYIDLTPVYEHLIKLLPAGEHVVLGNIKARLRMVVLYYYANLKNYLVCGTGNKTELELGYFTKYGDGGCDILPIGDLYKHEVRNIARVLAVPEKVIEKVPSAGLWHGQTDEAEIGFSYEEMDQTLQEIAKCRVEGSCAETLQNMIQRNLHKRQPPRICELKK